MTDRPILFSGPMVNAILEGRKTQTRRVLNPQPDFEYDMNDPLIIVNNLAAIYSPPRYQIGDRLYVREAWRVDAAWDLTKPSEIELDGSDWYPSVCYEATDPEKWEIHGKVRPSIFMPRWASRLTLVVTDVRVQRVQEISEGNAIAEGIQVWTDGAGCPWFSHDDTEDVKGDPREAFECLWNSINEPRGFGWDAKPWVVAVTFVAHQCNIDQMEAA